MCRVDSRFGVLWLPLCALSLLASSPAIAWDWREWRGPAGQGVAEGTGYPTKFALNDGIAWTAELPGLGCSTPIVVADQAYVTCGIDGQDAVCRYDLADGSLVWQRTLGDESSGKHRNASGSNSSPVSDGKHVVVLYRSGRLACLDADGEVLWKTNLAERFGEIILWWDYGSSPVIAGDLAIVVMMHAGKSYLAAFELASGELAWQTDRTFEGLLPECDQSYATPVVIADGDRRTIVTWGADHLTGHNAATGRLLWSLDGFNPERRPMWRTIASAPVTGRTAIVPYGRGGFLAGIELPDSRDDGEPRVAWRLQGVGADVPTPAVAGGRVIVLGDDGALTCVEAASGEKVWQAALPRSSAKFYASPTLAGDVLYCVREDGVIFAGLVDDGFRQTAQIEMGERMIASPAPLDGRLLLRGERHLFLVNPQEDSATSDDRPIDDPAT